MDLIIVVMLLLDCGRGTGVAVGSLERSEWKLPWPLPSSSLRGGDDDVVAILELRTSNSFNRFCISRFRLASEMICIEEEVSVVLEVVLVAATLPIAAAAAPLTLMPVMILVLLPSSTATATAPRPRRVGDDDLPVAAADADDDGAGGDDDDDLAMMICRSNQIGARI